MLPSDSEPRNALPIWVRRPDPQEQPLGVPAFPEAKAKTLRQCASPPGTNSESKAAK